MTNGFDTDQGGGSALKVHDEARSERIPRSGSTEFAEVLLQGASV